MPDPADAGDSADAGPRRSRSGRATVVLVSVLLSVGVLACTSQPWVQASLGARAGVSALTTLDVLGGQAAPLVTSTALVALACAGALTVAGPRTRRLVLLLAAAASVGVVLGSVGVLGDPAASARPALAGAAGLTPGSLGAASIEAGATAWVWATAVLGALLLVLNGWALAACRSWPGARRFEQQPAPAPGDASRSPAPRRGGTAQDWDALTRGEDPTRGRAHGGGQG